jgi:hypothetical protein
MILILNKNRILICFTLSCLFTACATLPKAHLSTDEVELTKDNINALNGTYYRASEDTTWSASVRNDLSRNFYLISRKGDRLSLSVLNTSRIRVTLLNQADTVKSRVFRGKIEQGHFKFRRSVKVVPIILANHFWNGKTRIGLLSNGSLTVDSKRIFFGHVMIFPAADFDNVSEAEHKKIDY